MATSVSSERAFSAAGITISKRRNRLGADIVEALQVLKCFFRRDLLFREVEDPSIALETQLDGQTVPIDTSNKSWDELIEDVDDEPASSVLDMQGDDDDDVVIPNLN